MSEKDTVLTIRGDISMEFRQVVRLTAEQVAKMKESYAEALQKEPKERRPEEHILVAAEGDVETAMQIAIRAACREFVTADPESPVSKGSVKVTFRGYDTASD